MSVLATNIRSFFIHRSDLCLHSLMIELILLLFNPFFQLILTLQNLIIHFIKLYLFYSVVEIIHFFHFTPIIILSRFTLSYF